AGFTALVCAMALLAIAVVIGTLTYSARCEHRIAQLEEVQRELYVQAMQTDVVPVGIVARLESEAVKLAGATGTLSQIPETFSALESLRRLVSTLPTELRFRMHDIRIDSKKIVVRGETRSFGDADAIASLLGKSNIDVQPLQTERLNDEGVGFTLTGLVTNQNPNDERPQ
ncbi:MAG: hypothetical protein KDA87_26090, partial [Planctomycetales bacterium]|nr:hypothetical protein [Planctomycetales bacterium]